MYTQEYLELAHERLTEVGLSDRHLNGLPHVLVEGVNSTAGPCRYSRNPQFRAAKTLVFRVLPFSTSVDDESIQVRLQAEQMALGPEYDVIGCEVYNPRIQKYPEQHRDDLKEGDYSLLSQRLREIIEATRPRGDQEIAIRGFSFGGDVVADMVRGNLTDPQKGTRPINYMGVYEPGRTQHLGDEPAVRARKMVGAFLTSGGQLWNNIHESSSPALLEARHIRGDGKLAETKHMLGLAKGLGRYVMADPKGIYAGFAGSGLDTTRQHLQVISTHPDQPWGVYGRMQNSHITSSRFDVGVTASDKLWVVRYPDLDHAADDLLQAAVAMDLETLRQPLAA